MSLRFIIGSSGSGKSTYIYNRIIKESAGDIRQNYLVIVPEQFTLETQRRLVALHPNHSILNIDILSFDRLAHRVFDEFCESGLSLLDDTGKNLILRRVAEEVSEELVALKSRIKTPGYIDQVKSLLSEFEQYAIDRDGIAALAEADGTSEAFKNKIHDLLIIHERYMEYIKKDHITAEQRYELLAELLPQSKVVRDAVVVLDGYTGFTPVQNVLLSQIISLSRDTYVTATMDVGEDIFTGEEHELFYMTKKMIRSLTKIARDAGVDVEDPVYVDSAARFFPGGRLEFLEKNIFYNIRKNGKKRSFVGESKDEIRVYRLDTPKEEIEFAASMIRRMVAESAKDGRKLRYSDFAIVSGSPEIYDPYLEEVFSDHGIPVFSDRDTEVVFQPCLEFLLSALSVLIYDFKYDDVIGFLRTGLTGISVPDVDLFDQFLFRTGIRGKNKYGHIFTIRPKEFSEEEHTRINEIRQSIHDSFAPLFDVYLKKNSVVKKTEALRAFLDSFDIRAQLEEKSRSFEESGDAVRAMEYGAVYDTVSELFDKMDAILSDIEVTGSEFSDLISSGLSAIFLGVIPRDFDRVIFGDIERTRLSGIKKLILIGANDGVIPKDSSSPNIFSQNERMVLKDAGVELAPTLRERSFMQRFYLYELLTQGSEGLYITFSNRDTQGASVRPSYIINEIRSLFPDARIEAMDRMSAPKFWIATESEAKKTFVMLLRQFITTGGIFPDPDKDNRDKTVLFATLLVELKKKDPDGLKELLGAAFYRHSDERISKSVIRAINGDEMHVSVSRIEKYAACAYAYFLAYGLKLEERREHEFEFSDMGTLYHEALKNYSDMIHAEGKSWRDVGDDEQEAYLDRAVTEAYNAAARIQIMENPRERYILNGMKRTLKKTVSAIHHQVKGGEFEPKEFEVSLSKIGSMSALSYELSDASRLYLSGQIDRIDTCEKGDTVLLKIIDYKSGNKALDYMSMYYGLQIQLVFYMNAVLEGMQERQPDKRIVPAAFFYYHIDDPVIEASGPMTDGEIFDKQIMELRPTGSIKDDAGVVAALDTRAAEAMANKISYKSDLAKVEIKKDGGISSRSETISDEDMDVMRDFVKQTVRQAGEDIISGRIDVNPYQTKDRDACQYCSYKGVCGFDRGLPGFSYNRLKDMGKKEEIIEEMKIALYATGEGGAEGASESGADLTSETGGVA